MLRCSQLQAIEGGTEVLNHQLGKLFAETQGKMYRTALALIRVITDVGDQFDHAQVKALSPFGANPVGLCQRA